MLDTYNQAIHENVACTIRTNINTANHHFIMEKIDRVGAIHKGQSGVVYRQDGIAPTITTNKGDGQLIAEPVIIQRGHGYNSGGKFKEVAPTITGSTWHFNNVTKEPVVLGWTRDSREKIVDRHPVEVANCVTAAKRDNTQNYVVVHTMPKKEVQCEIVGTLNVSMEKTGRVYGVNGIAPTCDTCQGGGRETKICEPNNYRIRKLTERECFRLMGVHDEDSDKIRAIVSKSQCYKLAGNSIVVDVMVRIFDQLLFGNKNKNQQLEIF